MGAQAEERIWGTSRFHDSKKDSRRVWNSNGEKPGMDFNRLPNIAYLMLEYPLKLHRFWRRHLYHRSDTSPTRGITFEHRDSFHSPSLIRVVISLTLSVQPSECSRHPQLSSDHSDIGSWRRIEQRPPCLCHVPVSPLGPCPHTCPLVHGTSGWRRCRWLPFQMGRRLNHVSMNYSNFGSEGPTRGNVIHADLQPVLLDLVRQHARDMDCRTFASIILRMMLRRLDLTRNRRDVNDRS